MSPRAGRLSAAAALVLALVWALAACTRSPAGRPAAHPSSPPAPTASASPSAPAATASVGVSLGVTPGVSPSPSPSRGVAPTPTKSAAAGYVSLAAAQAYVQAQAEPGYPFSILAPDTTWRPSAVLHVLHGTPQGTASYGGDYYFFFANGNPVGKQYFTGAIGEGPVDPTTFSVTYKVYKPADAHCCPSGGQATVRFHWDGARLKPLDPLTGATQS